MTSVDDLLDNDRLFDYALTAFGLNPNAAIDDRDPAGADQRSVRSGQLCQHASPTRAIARSPRLSTSPPDGTISGSDGAQSGAQVDSTTDLYLTTYDDAAAERRRLRHDFYRNRINLMTSVDALIDNSTLYNYVLEAFGLRPDDGIQGQDPAGADQRPSDPHQLCQPASSTRAIATSPRPSISGPTARCCSRARPRSTSESWQPSSSTTHASATSASEAGGGTEENAYYHNTIIRVRSLDDFLADKRLVAYVLKAYGLEGEQHLQ